MVSRHTFHTPSFGDEEFEFPQMQHGTLLGGGVNHTYDMSGVSATDNYSEWSSSINQSDHMKADGGISLVANDFVVLRSPQDAVENTNANSSMAEQPLSSDESDDGMKPDAKQGPGDMRRKQKRDPNAPQKPVSAYALFFRDTQAAIKGQNPSASFTEVSKIVASMWDVLDPEHKDVYKKKAEDAKKEYRKSLSAYRSSILARSDDIPARVDKPQVIDSTPVPQQQAQVITVQASPIVNAISTVSSLSLNQSQQQVASSAVTTTNQTTQNIGMSAENPVAPTIVAGQTCVRSGCPNPAVVSIDWEDEYCSNECVITHCRDIFSRWVQDISATPETYTTS